MLEPTPAALRPGARNTDPETSHEADAEQRKRSFGRQAKLVLAAVKKWPGRSSMGLATEIHAEWLHSSDFETRRPLDRYQVARRLSDLRDLGKVENRFDHLGQIIKSATGILWWAV